MLGGKLWNSSIVAQHIKPKSQWSRCFCSTIDDEKEKELKKIAENASINEPPTSCCQSGCANCVYVAWAEALSKKINKADPEIAEKILNMVEDPSMKAFLEMELKLRGLKTRE